MALLSSTVRLPEPLVEPLPAPSIAERALARDEVVRPGGPLDNARKNPLLPKVNGLYTLHKTEIDSAWSLEARAGRSQQLNVRGLVAGLRYAPAPGFEIAPLELRVGKQPNGVSKASVGARLSYSF